MNPQEQYQKKFFQYISNRVGVDRVLFGTMETLGIRKGAAYKRMNGDTALTTAELVNLASFFQVSLDTIFQEDKFITFQHPFYQQKSTMDFLEQFRHFLKPMSSMPRSQLIYLANELPVFYYFSHRYIFNFLLSIWNHLHWSDSKLQIEENTEVTNQITLITKEITSYYEEHPVTEIWNSNMLANLYQQIIFCVTIRAFKEEVYVRHLIEDIQMLIEHLKLLVENKESMANNDRKIYINDYGNYLNLLLFDSEKIKSSFIGYDIPQFIVSYNQKFFQFSKEWLARIKQRSVLISAGGYQNKELFFVKMENDFKYFKEKVEKLMKVYYE